MPKKSIEFWDFYNYMKSNEIMVRRYYTATHSLTFYRNKFIEFNNLFFHWSV